MIADDVLNVLENCTVKDCAIYLPPKQLDRDLYLKVAKQLQAIGGKWKGGKIQAFVYDANPQHLLDVLLEGDFKDPKKELQMFFTPESVLNDYIWPELKHLEFTSKTRILEPSAGSGNIIKFLFDKVPELKQIDCCEIAEINRKQLDLIPGAMVIADDFLSLITFKEHYDLIVANPPFAKNQDIDHIYKMYECLAPGGTLVSIASRHWLNSSHKKESAFLEWIDRVGCYHLIPEGAFKESGTMIATCYVIIRKPGKLLCSNDIAPLKIVNNQPFGIKIG